MRGRVLVFALMAALATVGCGSIRTKTVTQTQTQTVTKVVKSKPKVVIGTRTVTTPQAPTPTSTQSQPSRSGGPCGTVTGGKYDYQGQTLTVYAGAGVPCNTAMQVITDLSAGKALNHQGPDQLSSYFLVDGWTCGYGNMDTQPCSKGSLHIDAYAPGAGP